MTLNLLTFQFLTDVERYYVMGIYITPNDSLGVEDLWAAWNSCPADCVPLILGNLNIKLDYLEEAIADLVDEINLVDASRKFALQWCQMQGAKKQRSGWRDGINPSLITFWYGRRIFGLSGRRHSGRPWSIIRIIGQSLRPSTQGVCVEWQYTADDYNASPCSSFRNLIPD